VPTIEAATGAGGGMGAAISDVVEQAVRASPAASRIKVRFITITPVTARILASVASVT
jgi:hypothetical protein